jgi:hypothetical protein
MPTNYRSKPNAKARSTKPARGIAIPTTPLELKEPTATYYVRNIEIPEFFGRQLKKGERLPVDESAGNHSPRLFYSHPHGEIWLGDSIEWLRSLDSGSVDLIFVKADAAGMVEDIVKIGGVRLNMALQAAVNEP